MTDALPPLLRRPAVLEGPYAEITIGERHLEIYVRPGCANQIDKAHGRKLREAAERWMPGNPNPCLTPLDEADEAGFNNVWGKITINGGSS